MRNKLYVFLLCFSKAVKAKKRKLEELQNKYEQSSKKLKVLEKTLEEVKVNLHEFFITYFFY